MPQERSIPNFQQGERVGASRLNGIATPLNQTAQEFNERERLGLDDPAIKLGVVTAWVVGTYTRGGTYRIKIGTPKQVMDTSVSSSDEWDCYNWPDNEDGVLLNQAENGKSTHRISSDPDDHTLVDVWLKETPTDQPLPTFGTNFNYAERKTRWNETTHCLEVSYKDKETYVDADYEPIENACADDCT